MMKTSIFPGPRTGGVFYGSYLRTIVVKASETCKFKHVVPYGLQNSYCVNGIWATGDIEYVAQQMGHKTVQTTLGIYNRHVTNAGRMRSARALEESFGYTSTPAKSVALRANRRAGPNFTGKYPPC